MNVPPHPSFWLETTPETDYPALDDDVSWNSAERSWDCPCHESRYSGEGEVIQGPTVAPLRRLDE